MAGAARGRAARAQPALAFRNLAVEGATSEQVLEQLPEAIELEPDLVTVVCGANDVLRTPGPTPAPTRGAWPRSSAACSARTRRCAWSPRPRPSAGTSSSSARGRATGSSAESPRQPRHPDRRRCLRGPLPRGRGTPRAVRAGELQRRRPASVAARPSACRARVRGADPRPLPDPDLDRRRNEMTTRPSSDPRSAPS